jgi:hypothetical protein
MFCLVSNAPDLEAALDARFDSGPLNNVCSTPIMELEIHSSKQALKSFEEKYIAHPVFRCRKFSLYYWEDDEQNPN